MVGKVFPIRWRRSSLRNTPERNKAGSCRHLGQGISIEGVPPRLKKRQRGQEAERIEWGTAGEGACEAEGRQRHEDLDSVLNETATLSGLWAADGRRLTCLRRSAVAAARRAGCKAAGLKAGTLLHGSRWGTMEVWTMAVAGGKVSVGQILDLF